MMWRSVPEVVTHATAEEVEIIFHPSVETAYLKTITGSWQQRVWEAQLFSDPLVKKFFEDNGIIITNWREVMLRHKGV